MQKKKAVTYSRVATQEQAQQGYSLELQREQLKEYAEKNNLEIVREFSDIESSVGDKRQGFQEMLKFLEDSENCKTILVTKADRLCRDIKTLSELQAKYTVITVNCGADNMINQVQIILTQNYSAYQSECIKKGLQKRKEVENKKEVNMKKNNNKAEQWVENWVAELNLQKQNEYEQEKSEVNKDGD
jgi:DNA invertase Pin-like site-specific DNA recombinase